MVEPPIAKIEWNGGVRIIRSHYPPIDLFEDIADPEDWGSLIAAEMKTNPRLVQSIGNLDLVPAARRVSGPGASFLMAPFTHASIDRPSRFSDGRFGVLYIAEGFDTAVAETIYHHARFMAATDQRPGWTSHFREITLDVGAGSHDIRGQGFESLMNPSDYSGPQEFGAGLRAEGSDGIVYESVRATGDCAALFYPDGATNARQGRHLDYHWDGARVDLVRDLSGGDVYRVA
ncbi:MAG: RES family NAD+ phosphorylase [Boseongicola sp.]